MEQLAIYMKELLLFSQTKHARKREMKPYMEDKCCIVPWYVPVKVERTSTF